MMRVFVDTNILIDYALGRERGDDAAQLLQYGKCGFVDLTASYLTFANMAYILKGKTDVYGLLQELHSFIEVLPADDMQLQAALAQRVRDFEDMLQYQCAKAAGCDVIVTNNGRDFTTFSLLPVMTAAELLSSVSDTMDLEEARKLLHDMTDKEIEE
ncbi:MAG: PIN domain-containing protein [Prevotella sp.]|nr:PIN domain-containing protein [Prevotella sp.]MBQ9657126.1 PIN domain-containing protein [Prevotella sp.]